MRNARRKILGTLVTAIAGCVLIAAPAVGSGGSARGLNTVYSGSQTGIGAYVTVGGKLPELSVLKIRVRLNPKGPVNFTGKLNCGSGAKTFNFSGPAPLVRALPITGTKPRACSLTGKAKVQSGGGTIILDVLGR